MSTSMWAWRVVVPGLGLASCLYVFYLTSKADSTGIRDLITGSTPAQPSPKRPTEPRVVAEGRVAARPGAEVTVGTEVGGIIASVPVAEKTKVKKGDLLVEFHADDQRAALADAEAKLAEAEAEFTYHNGEFLRRSNSKADAKQFVSELEGTRRDLAIAVARRRSANAAVARCRAVLARTRVVAPIDGVVLTRHVDTGEFAAPGAPLVTICDLSKLRVEAEVDEFDASRVALGDLAVITAEGHGATAWTGTVEEIPDQVGGRTLRPDDPGRPTDARVLLVKVALDKPLPLKLGQQVEVEIRRRPAILP